MYLEFLTLPLIHLNISIDNDKNLIQKFTFNIHCKQFGIAYSNHHKVKSTNDSVHCLDLQKSGERFSSFFPN